MALRKTKLTVREEYPLAFSSKAYNANIDAIGINMDYLSKARPDLAGLVLGLVEQIKKEVKPKEIR